MTVIFQKSKPNKEYYLSVDLITFLPVQSAPYWLVPILSTRVIHPRKGIGGTKDELHVYRPNICRDQEQGM